MKTNKSFVKKTTAILLTACVINSLFPNHLLLAATGGTLTATEQSETNENTSETQMQPATEVVTINSKDDFLAFAKNCNTDSWSVGKVIDLQTDISLSGMDFSQIPIFSGTFNGNGHTISGFEYEGDGYVTGLFRYLAIGSEINNLTVQGVIDSKNSKECVGSICGSNAGTINNCIFEGSVNGKNKTGGIVGINEATGTIRNCIMRGQVSGYYYTGGIAGQNFGSLEGCKNSANINADNAWVVEDDRMDWLKEISENDNKRLQSGVDTGGIVGYSVGIVINCENSGIVGYEHTGYNIGGIAGRQSGMLSNCINKGTVYGRKDIGGIVGQMEPYLSLNQTASLEDAVQGLHDKIDNTLTDMNNTKNAFNADCTTLQGYADNALSKSQVISTQMTDFANKNVASLAQVAGRIEYVADRFPNIVTQINAATSAMSAVQNDIQNMGQSAQDTIANIGQAAAGSPLPDINGQLNDAKDFSANISQADDALDNSDAIMNDIQNMLTDPDQEQHDSQEDTLVQGEENSSEISNEELQNKISELQTQVEIAQDNASSMLGTTSSIQQNMVTAGQNVDFGPLSNDTQTMTNALSEAGSQLKAITDYLNAQQDITFYQMDTAFQGNVNGLYSDLQGISSSMTTLRANMSDNSDKLTQDFREVNDQLNTVFMLFLERMDEIKSPTLNNVYQDISEEDIESTTQGKVAGCTNRGKVEGDINVGGVSGSMALDEEDPEENAAGSTEKSLGNRYLTKCILTDCKNYGTITAKKDGAGCINGYMYLGIINRCEAYGSAKSTEGDYVGGISGEATAGIRQCFSLCSLSGNAYVGGIAGYATNLRDSYAMSDVSCESGRGGAIAGQVGTEEDDYVMADHIIGNYYVCDDFAGIDNISYTGIAEPITYDTLLTVANLPLDYRHLTVYYMVDGKCIDSEEVPYGESLSKLNMPQVPKREGYNGSWQDVGNESMHGNVVLEAEYTDEITVLASRETSISGNKNGINKPCAYIDGKFTKESVLHAQKAEEKYPDNIKKDTASIYDISMENIKIDADNPPVLRLLNTAGEKACVFKQVDGKWKELDAAQKGGYLQIASDDLEGTYCIAEKSSQMETILMAAGIILIIVSLIMIRRKKQKPKKNSGQTQK